MRIDYKILFIGLAGMFLINLVSAEISYCEQCWIKQGDTETIFNSPMTLSSSTVKLQLKEKFKTDLSYYNLGVMSKGTIKSRYSLTDQQIDNIGKYPYEVYDIVYSNEDDGKDNHELSLVEKGTFDASKESSFNPSFSKNRLLKIGFNSVNYSSSTETLTIVSNRTDGNCSISNFTFEDIYQADLNNASWNVTEKFNGTYGDTYRINASLIIGDDINATCIDSFKEVIDLGFNHSFQIRDNSALRLGESINGHGTRGSVFRFGGANNTNHLFATAEGSMFVYGSRLELMNTVQYVTTAGTVFVVHESDLIGRYDDLSGDVGNFRNKFNLKGTENYFNRVNYINMHGIVIGGQPNEFIDVYFNDQEYPIVFNSQDSVIQNVKVGEYSSSTVLASNILAKQLTLIDPVDEESFTYELQINESHVVLVNYTINLKILNSSGSALENANVTLINVNGEQMFSILTNASGEIIEQQVTAKKVNQTDEFETFYSPFTLTINANTSNYQLYNATFNISDPLDYQINVQDYPSDPIVLLVGPINGGEDTDTIVDFYYLVSDSVAYTNSISNCSLYLDYVLEDTSFNVQKGEEQNFRVRNILQSDNMEWYVTCADIFNNIGNSSVYSLDTKLGGGHAIGGGGGVYSFINETIDDFYNLLGVSNISIISEEEPAAQIFYYKYLFIAFLFVGITLFILNKKRKVLNFVLVRRRISNLIN